MALLSAKNRRSKVMEEAVSKIILVVVIAIFACWAATIFFRNGDEAGNNKQGNSE